MMKYRTIRINDYLSNDPMSKIIASNLKENEKIISIYPIKAFQTDQFSMTYDLEALIEIN